MTECPDYFQGSYYRKYLSWVLRINKDILGIKEAACEKNWAYDIEWWAYETVFIWLKQE